MLTNASSNGSIDKSQDLKTSNAVKVKKKASRFNALQCLKAPLALSTKI